MAEVTPDSFLGGLQLVLSCNWVGAGVRAPLSCSQSVPLKEWACSFGLHTLLQQLHSFGSGQIHLMAKLLQTCPQCNKTKTRSSFPVAFSPHFLHHFNRTKKFYKWKTHALPLEHFKSKKNVCCGTEMLSHWGNSGVESISNVFRFVDSLFGQWQKTGTIHPSCFQAYFRISLITP